LVCHCIQRHEYKLVLVCITDCSYIAGFLEGFHQHLDRVDRGKVDKQQELVVRVVAVVAVVAAEAVVVKVDTRENYILPPLVG
jgi:hypothetical protein